MDSLRKNNKVLLVMLFALAIVLIALAVSAFSYSKPGTVENKINFNRGKCYNFNRYLSDDR